MLISIVIRTYNEERHLNELLLAIDRQELKNFEYEVVIVDSGSTDNTLAIATAHNCKVTYIEKSKFTFGRSLNIGCEFALGDILVFVSGHCIPASTTWLQELCAPIAAGKVVYAYGRQIGRDTTQFSERCHFDKCFPGYSKVPQDGYFCNNANAAIDRKAWELFRFNEELTGLEDMYLAKLLVESGRAIGYVATAPVYHIHNETWHQVKLRYEREAYALQRIMPEVQFTLVDFVKYFCTGTFTDSRAAIREHKFFQTIFQILWFRFFHYWGTFKGSQEHRKISSKMKQQYFYPLDTQRETYHVEKSSRTFTNEGQQR